MLSQYVLAAYLYINGYLGLGVLLLLLALPTLIQTYKVFNQIRPSEMPQGFRQEVWPLWFAPHAFGNS